MSMRCRKHRHINYKINNRTRTVNGVPVFFVAGTWYCDYNTYTNILGRHINIEVFCDWCDRFDLCPT